MRPAGGRTASAAAGRRGARYETARARRGRTRDKLDEEGDRSWQKRRWIVCCAVRAWWIFWSGRCRWTWPIGGGRLLEAQPIEVTTGGIVSNAGIAMAKLGMQVAAFSYTGNDEWAAVIRRKLDAEGVDTQALLTHPTGATSTTAVLIDPSGERSFAHCVGAPRLMDKEHFLEHLDLFAHSRMTLIGYYSLMPRLEPDLPEVLAAIRQTGCQTALDAAGSGGAMQPLDRILPHLDVYVPSRSEAIHQTGEQDPRRIIDTFRGCGARACWA